MRPREATGTLSAPLTTGYTPLLLSATMRHALLPLALRAAPVDRARAVQAPARHDPTGPVVVGPGIRPARPRVLPTAMRDDLRWIAPLMAESGSALSSARSAHPEQLPDALRRAGLTPAQWDGIWEVITQISIDAMLAGQPGALERDAAPAADASRRRANVAGYRRNRAGVDAATKVAMGDAGR